MAGEALQLASAVTSLISATCIAIGYLRRVHHASASARELLDKITDLSNLLNDIQDVVEILGNTSSQVSHSRTAIRLLRGIESRLQSCHESIQAISHLCEPISERGGFMESTRYVYRESETRSRLSTIETHMDSLKLSLVVLNMENNNQDNRITHKLLGYLCELLVLHLSTQQQQSYQPLATLVQAQDIDGFHAVLPSNTAGQLLQIPGNSLPSLPTIQFNENFWSVNEPHASPEPLSAVPIHPVHTGHLHEITNDRENQRVETEHQEPLIRLSSSEEFELLAIAVKSDCANLVRKHIEESSNFTSLTDADGSTLLHHAVIHEAFESLLVILESEKGKDPNFINAKDLDERTALMLCAKQAESDLSFRIAQKLIESGAQVQIEDHLGRTALSFLVENAAIPNRRKICKLLLNKDAILSEHCTSVPRKADDYPGVREMAQTRRRASSAESTTLPINSLTKITTKISSSLSRRHSNPEPTISPITSHVNKTARPPDKPKKLPIAARRPVEETKGLPSVKPAKRTRSPSRLSFFPFKRRLFSGPRVIATMA